MSRADARLIGICSYYDEDPRWLGELMASLAPICSEFVFVDGAYALFPGANAHPSSPAACMQALNEMAVAVDRPLLHYRPRTPFIGNEVEKRNLSFDLARSLPGVAGDTSVWFLVVDADTVATKVNDALPRALAATDRDVAEYAYEPEPSLWEVPDDRWAFVERAELAKPQHIRCIYRNLPGLRYGPAHYHVSGFSHGERVHLRCGTLDSPAPAFDATLDLRFEHRRAGRVPGRNEAAARYYNTRDAAGIERR